MQDEMTPTIQEEKTPLDDVEAVIEKTPGSR